ncbi:MAG: hypothetical protein MUO26_16020 [Methanotrichaceae archaeon]|nr:hypothetical protein [Methanotrichaceae archaeon]
MRTKILIAVSFSLLALFAISTHAIDNQYGFSADQLIDASRGIYPYSGPSPQEARANWGRASGVDYTKPSVAPESSNITTTQTAPSQGVATPSATSAAGNWSFSLKDSENRSMNLTLSQSGDILLGVGNMNENNRTQMVSASGFLVGDKLDLNVISLATANLYSLSLTKKDYAASGEYKAFTSVGESWIGMARGY